MLSESQQIEEFLQARGVTKCPPAYVAPVTGAAPLNTGRVIDIDAGRWVDYTAGAAASVKKGGAKTADRNRGQALRRRIKLEAEYTASPTTETVHRLAAEAGCSYQRMRDILREMGFRQRKYHKRVNKGSA